MKINEFNSIESGIGDVDIIYVTRVQEERFDSPKEANKYKGLLKLNQNIYTENCEPNTVIMHPLPRDSRPDANELDTDMNENPNLAIYRQTDNGLLVRMALISLILLGLIKLYRIMTKIFRGYLVKNLTDFWKIVPRSCISR